jgi:uncharacterized protein YaaR (DUF327 family)
MMTFSDIVMNGNHWLYWESIGTFLSSALKMNVSMKSKSSQPADSPKRDRVPVEIGDIRDKLSTLRNDVAWQELPMAAKLRVLILERVQQLEAEVVSEQR